ncbi:MAG: endonuclease/exonuclease/phosphatase family protein [Armatimonadetes bacterium]|nr:endonuclease/exonuclease/phosphatase family protein [Armatimonadota bacterium]
MRVGIALCIALLLAGCKTQRPTAIGASNNSLRVVTYNMEWLSTRINPARASSLRAVLNDLRPDVLAAQEVEDEAALQRLVGDEYRVAVLAPEPDKQNLAIAVRTPFRLKEAHLLFPGPEDESSFPNNRDVLLAVVETPGQEVLNFFVVHFKSRRGGRLDTEAQRLGAARKLSDYLRRNPTPNAIILGDFNDTPDDKSANILESGNPNTGYGSAPQTRFKNLTQPVFERDGVSLDFYEYAGRADSVARVAGARRENNRFFGKRYNFPDDVRVRATLFDQILVSPDLASRVSGEARIYCKPMAVRGDRGDESTQTLPSDHLPVYIDLDLSKR